MSQTQLRIDIVTPYGVLFSDDATSCIAKGLDGKFQILSSHAALLSNIALGEIKIDTNNTTRKLATSGGFLEVKDNNISIIVESAEFADDIDMTRAKEAEKRAKKRKQEKGEVDLVRVEFALMRAINRIKVSSRI